MVERTSAVSGPSFQIRVRESTIYSRWTTNGYDLHVELQSTSADPVCAEVVFYPNNGDSLSGTWSGGLLVTPPVTIPAFGANKVVLHNGTAVGAPAAQPIDNRRGGVRIGACGSPANLLPSAVHVSTFAYNPITDKFLYFFTNTANNGATSNSW